MKGLKHLLAGSILAATALGGTAAQAEVTFTLGNTGGIGEINILFQASETGTTITGQIDHSGIPAVFSTLTGQTLNQKAQGQADIFNASGALLTSMNMNSPGYGYGDAIINLNNGTGTALVTVTDNLSQTFTYALGNGQNFLTMQVVPGSGEEITNIAVTMTGAGGWEDFKQPRVSDVCKLSTDGKSCTLVNIAEPASIALLGLGVLGIGLVARRRSNTEGTPA